MTERYRDMRAIGCNPLVAVWMIATGAVRSRWLRRWHRRQFPDAR